MLPPLIQKKAKRSGRWRSPAHRAWVRGHACCNCGSTTALEFAHLRIGSGAGLGEKPDDWRGTPLCHECHQHQHYVGEPEFWARYEMAKGHTVHDLIDAFCKASPKAAEIRSVRNG